MAEIDCWRLLGISPPVTADEVRAAFARRAREVHPDSGGSGDSLTMSLLVDARDEALARVAGNDGAARDRPQQRSRRAEATSAAGLGTCYVCQQRFPPGRLYDNRIYRGFRGRDSDGTVLMCITCACEIEAEYGRRRRLGAVYGIVAVAATAALAVIAMLLQAG